ncbi:MULTISPECIES: UvrB/UvrC motif-containing protein [unclassified Paraburkholderia]|uniref:UvrB/UvrC motif-containing protein n=1 Tax=unclassified Paraburkholderia TaxID=2615204 RepID=UPI00161242FA|nr:MULTISPECIES: UvrB/UvrC motif-containing protein [unclassified Paraburkholderia]MBB5444613.1 hypothetical protein [Paraburkholderia sp. WSM4177]MBB5485437.1 hypothetical protein [Paraburkholderia sp. WSM4180]
MTLTKGRINRTGRVVFHDASLHVWEESLMDARDAGGWNAAQEWERQFKHDVFKRIVQLLRRLGWTVEPNTYIFTGNNNRFARKGALKADLKLCGRHIEFDMFQNVNAPTRPDHGGRYEFNQEALMPYLMRIEMERTRRRIRDYLCNVFTGYVFEQPKRDKRGPNGVTALEWVQQSYAESSHFKGDLTKYEISGYNNKSGDGGVIEHGSRVWFADYHGRIVTGTAYYNINNMWWVVTGKYDVRNEASFHLFTKCPQNLRVKRNADRRRKKLEKLLSAAVEKMDFERAAVLRDVLFPGNPELFNVWHDDHQMYHCAGFCGYTRDQSKAGKFTANELRGWDAKPNRIVAICAEAKAA